MKTPDDKMLASLIIGNFLRWGVLTAALIVACGGWLYLAQMGAGQAQLSHFVGVPEHFREVKSIMAEAWTGNGMSVIQAGLLVLILIPVIRVGLSVFIFLYERDWLYVGITVIVLTLLLLSLTLGLG